MLGDEEHSRLEATAGGTRNEGHRHDASRHVILAVAQRPPLGGMRSRRVEGRGRQHGVEARAQRRRGVWPYAVLGSERRVRCAHGPDCIRARVLARVSTAASATASRGGWRTRAPSMCMRVLARVRAHEPPRHAQAVDVAGTS